MLAVAFISVTISSPEQSVFVETIARGTEVVKMAQTQFIQDKT
jgi:hypothetical protein